MFVLHIGIYWPLRLPLSSNIHFAKWIRGHLLSEQNVGQAVLHALRWNEILKTNKQAQHDRIHSMNISLSKLGSLTNHLPLSHYCHKNLQHSCWATPKSCFDRSTKTTQSSYTDLTLVTTPQITIFRTASLHRSYFLAVGSTFNPRQD